MDVISIFKKDIGRMNIYSNAVPAVHIWGTFTSLEYFLVMQPASTLQFRSKYCAFYSFIFIWQL